MKQTLFRLIGNLVERFPNLRAYLAARHKLTMRRELEAMIRTNVLREDAARDIVRKSKIH